MPQIVTRISADLGVHVDTLYNWRKVWRLQVEVVPASKKESEGWTAAENLPMVMAGLSGAGLIAYCRKEGLFTAQVERWRHPAQNSNERMM